MKWFSLLVLGVSFGCGPESKSGDQGPPPVLKTEPIKAGKDGQGGTKTSLPVPPR